MLDKIELKNSIKWNVLLLLGSLTLTVFLIYKNNLAKTSEWATISFCAIIILFPIFKLFNRRPLLTISTDGLYFKNGDFKQWADIEYAIVEEIPDDLPAYRLKIQIANGKIKKINLTDLNYNKDEIVNLLELYKKKRLLTHAKHTVWQSK